MKVLNIRIWIKLLQVLQIIYTKLMTIERNHKIVLEKSEGKHAGDESQETEASLHYSKKKKGKGN